MVLSQGDLTPTPEPDTSTAYTATTPPETVSADLDDYDPFGGAKPSSFSVPWPGSTFIIRSVSSGEAITLLDGQIGLAPLGGRGSIHWACVETKGWLGFRNLVTGRFLGHNGKKGDCAAQQSDIKTGRTFALWPVGFKVEQEVETLAKIENGGSDGIVWEFVKV